MRFFIDTEFLEDGVTIEPISLAVVAEDGRELYIEFQFDEARAREHWFVSNFVLPHLRNPVRVSRAEAREALLLFLRPDECLAAVGSEMEFWAWYGAYDWVLLCQLFGPMVALPPFFPKFIRDMRQVIGDTEALKLASPPETQHDALVDARWLRDVFAANGKKRGNAGVDSYWLERARALTAELSVSERKRPPGRRRRQLRWKRGHHLDQEGADMRMNAHIRSSDTFLCRPEWPSAAVLTIVPDMLGLLQSARRSQAELALELSASVQTVRRALGWLEQVGVVVHRNKPRARGYSGLVVWCNADAALPLFRLTPAGWEPAST